MLAWITPDRATASKATYKAGRRGGDSIARRGCLLAFVLATERAMRELSGFNLQQMSFLSSVACGAFDELRKPKKKWLPVYSGSLVLTDESGFML